jgi:small subunit ribosomal protein S20
MATHESAWKEHRRSRKRRLANRDHKSRMRTAVKRFRAALAEKRVDEARTMLPLTLALVDRTARRGVIHPNAAARTKSRLQRALNQASA